MGKFEGIFGPGLLGVHEIYCRIHPNGPIQWGLINVRYLWVHSFNVPLPCFPTLLQKLWLLGNIQQVCVQVFMCVHVYVCGASNNNHLLTSPMQSFIYITITELGSWH